MIALLEAGSAKAPLMADIHASSFSKPWPVTEIKSLLAAHGAFAFLVGEDAFILAWVQADEAEVLTLAVRPSARRRGYARALLDAALVRAAAGGAKAVLLEVAHDNDAGRALYAQAGFREVGRRPAYYAGMTGRGDALVLRLDWP
jgi:[ribosomal protein S18]-alanine N-acetyltransferase